MPDPVQICSALSAVLDPASSNELRTQANTFLHAVRSDHSAWPFFLELLVATPHPSCPPAAVPHLVFFCLLAIEDAARARAISDPAALRRDLLRLACDQNSAASSPHFFPSFCLNKLAQLITVLLCPSSCDSTIDFLLTSAVRPAIQRLCSNEDTVESINDKQNHSHNHNANGNPNPSPLNSTPANCPNPSAHALFILEFFLRVSMAIDQEIVNTSINRSIELAEFNQKIKDKMREKTVAELVHTWFSIAMNFHSKYPHLVSQVLQIVGLFVSWIDISLVATEAHIGLVFALAQNSEFLLACSLFYIEVINKGMEPNLKIQIYAKCRVLDFLSYINSQLTDWKNKKNAAKQRKIQQRYDSGGTESDSGDEDSLGELADMFVRLLNAFGVSLTTSWFDSKSNDWLHFTIEKDLVMVLEPILEYFCMSYEYGDQLHGVLIEYTKIFKKKVKSTEPTEYNSGFRDQLRLILIAVVQKLRYPNNAQVCDYEPLYLAPVSSSAATAITCGSSSSAAGPSTPSQDGIVDDDSSSLANFAAMRRRTQTLYDSIAYIDYPMWNEHVTSHVAAVLAGCANAPNSLSWQDAELTMLLIFMHAEGVKVAASSPLAKTWFSRQMFPSSHAYRRGELTPTGAMIFTMLQSKIWEIPNSAPPIAVLLETAARYASFFIDYPDAIPLVLRLFAEARVSQSTNNGVSGSNASVAGGASTNNNATPTQSSASLASGQACDSAPGASELPNSVAMRARAGYLLLRFVKETRSRIAPYVGDIVGFLLPYLSPAVDRPGALDTPLFETIGVLLSVDSASVNNLEERRVCLENILGSLVQRVVGSSDLLSSASEVLHQSSTTINTTTTLTTNNSNASLSAPRAVLCNAIVAIGALSKEFAPIASANSSSSASSATNTTSSASAGSLASTTATSQTHPGNIPSSGNDILKRSSDDNGNVASIGAIAGALFARANVAILEALEKNRNSSEIRAAVRFTFQRTIAVVGDACDPSVVHRLLGALAVDSSLEEMAEVLALVSQMVHRQRNAIDLVIEPLVNVLLRRSLEMLHKEPAGTDEATLMSHLRTALFSFISVLLGPAAVSSSIHSGSESKSKNETNHSTSSDSSPLHSSLLASDTLPLIPHLFSVMKSIMAPGSAGERALQKQVISVMTKLSHVWYSKLGGELGRELNGLIASTAAQICFEIPTAHLRPGASSSGTPGADAAAAAAARAIANAANEAGYLHVLCSDLIHLHTVLNEAPASAWRCCVDSYFTSIGAPSIVNEYANFLANPDVAGLRAFMGQLVLHFRQLQQFS